MRTPAKLVVFAAAETGVGRSMCAARIAMSLSQRSRCLALDLDYQTRNLQSYLGAQPQRGFSEFFENPAPSLEAIRSKTGSANLDCIGWSPSNRRAIELGSLKIESLLRSLDACAADYVLASLPAEMPDDSIELFAAADFPILVTWPSPSALKRAVELLSECDSRRFEGRPVFLLVNRTQRGGEEKDAAAAVEKARADLAMDIRLIGTVQYDPQLESGFQPNSRLSSATSLALEDIAFKIERMPKPLQAAPAPEPRAEAPVKKSRRRNSSETLREQLEERDETIRRLEHEHKATVEALREQLRKLQEDHEVRGPSPAVTRMDRTGGFEITILVRPNEGGTADHGIAVKAPLPSKASLKRNYLIPIAVVGWVLLAIFAGNQFLNRQPEVRADAAPAGAAPAAPAALPSLPAEAVSKIPQAIAAPIPLPTPETVSAAVSVSPSVVRRILPDVPQKARDTIRGTVRTSVKVVADESGKVTDVTVESRGPSAYFAGLAMEAARDWKFSGSSEWVLRFEFTNMETSVHAAHAPSS